MNDQRIDHHAQAIAVLVGRMRTDWQHAGILTAVRKAFAHGQAYGYEYRDVARACVNAAADLRNRTPAILGMPGDHWRTGTTQQAAQPPRSSEACPTHPAQFRASCCYCTGLDDQLDDAPDIHELEAQGVTGRALYDRTRPPTTHRRRQEQAS